MHKHKGTEEENTRTYMTVQRSQHSFIIIVSETFIALLKAALIHVFFGFFCYFNRRSLNLTFRNPVLHLPSPVSITVMEDKLNCSQFSFRDLVLLGALAGTSASSIPFITPHSRWCLIQASLIWIVPVIFLRYPVWSVKMLKTTKIFIPKRRKTR